MYQFHPVILTIIVYLKEIMKFLKTDLKLILILLFNAVYDFLLIELIERD